MSSSLFIFYISSLEDYAWYYQFLLFRSTAMDPYLESDILFYVLYYLCEAAFGSAGSWNESNPAIA